MQFVCKYSRFFANRYKEDKMKQKLLIFILAFIFSLPAHSAPARKGLIYLNQPDGTCFSAYILGDEFMKITTTVQGHAVIQDSEGWWCYAEYDSEGRKHSTEWKVGTDTPKAVLSASLRIPYAALKANATMKRNSIRQKDEQPILARIMKQGSVETKAGSPTVKHGLIILAQFKDVRFTYAREDFEDMLTLEGYDRNGATGSAKEYFDDQLGDSFDFSFDVSNIVTLPENMAFYGSNGTDGSDKNPAQMIADACRLADNEVDFSLYDDDNDNIVDNVFVFFAGGDEAEGAGDDCIWSHAWYIYSGAGKSLTLDGKMIDRYACTSELTRIYTSNGKYRELLAGIGTFCHEYFHTFGIPDMYDTDYEESGGTAAGLWARTSLMDAGNQNNYGNTPPNLNAIEREYLGVSEPEIIDSDGGFSLTPIHHEGRYFRMDTDNKDEYYLFECRDNEGWDKYIGGRGMLVYHIDRSDNNAGYSDGYEQDMTAMQRWMYSNEVNCRPDHQCADLLEADSRQDSFSGSEQDAFNAALQNIRGIFFPSGDVTSIKAEGKPGFTFWSGSPGKASMTNIRDNGNGVSFNIIGFTEIELPPTATGVKSEAFMDAAIRRFESDRPCEGEAVIAWGRAGEKQDTIRVFPYEPGKYSVTLEGLMPDNKTYTADIFFEVSGITGDAVSASFMTKKTPVVPWPFIYMNNVEKNSDGTLPAGSKLPLRVYNATDAAEIRWTFDGKAIKTGGDGYYTVDKSGELKAHIIMKDGSEETVMKEIIIGMED